MLKYIIQDMGAMLSYLPYGFAAGAFMAVLLCMINIRRKKKQRKPVRVMAGTCFVMYAVIMVIITFLSRESGVSNGIDLELFSTWGINTRNNAMVMENVLLFIPYGFVCAWAIKSAERFFGCVLLALVTSTGIELLQLVSGRGFFQIDDILTNMIGAIIGFLLYKCIPKKRKTGDCPGIS